MSDFANKISSEIIALEQECERHKRDSAFYQRLLIQIALQSGGSIGIDSAFGEEAINGRYGFEINSTGFHLLKPPTA